MWIRKSEEEIKEILSKREQKKKSLFRPIFFGSLFALIFMILHAIGFRGGSLRQGVFLFSSSANFFNPQTIFVGGFGFVMFFLIAFYLQRKGSGIFPSEETLLCSNCYNPLSENETKTCHCGGRLEPYEFFVWNEPLTGGESR